MQKEFDILKKYLANPIHSSLIDIGSSPSYFVNSFNHIFEDEEIFGKYGNFESCFCCLAADIRFAIINKSRINSFIQNIKSYSYEERILITNDLLQLLESYDTNDELEITYCGVCGRILAIFGVPYVFYFESLDTMYKIQGEILEKEGTISQNWGDVRICPKCHSHKVKHKDAYCEEGIGEVEFRCVCKNCGYEIGYFAYGSVEYPPSAQNEMFEKAFKNFKSNEPYWDLDDELPFN